MDTIACPAEIIHRKHPIFLQHYMVVNCKLKWYVMRHYSILEAVIVAPAVHGSWPPPSWFGKIKADRAEHDCPWLP